MVFKTISELASVIQGYVFREALQYDSAGGLGVVQASNLINGRNFLDLNSVKKIHTVPNRAKSFLEKGDVIVSSRAAQGVNFKAGMYAGSQLPMIASSSVYILRPDTSSVLPEFLAMYLNSQPGLVQLEKSAGGTNVKAIFRQNLEMLTIPVPTIKEQKMLANLMVNIDTQCQLLERKVELNRSLLQATLTQAVSK